MTRRRSLPLTLLAATALAVPLIATASPASRPPTLQFRNEAEKSDEEKQKDALKLIAEVADRVVSPAGLPSVLDMIAVNDRTRLEAGMKKPDAKKASEKLAAPAKQFGQIWREKYKEGFDATDNFDQLKGMRVELRTISDKQYAFIYFPAFGGWKPFEMHLTKSANSEVWRIQLPDKVDAEHLATNLSNDVAKLCADKDHWYGDKFLDYNSAVTQLVHAMSFATDAQAGQSGK